MRVLFGLGVVATVSFANADVLVNTFGQTGLGYFPTVGWNLNSGQMLGKTFTIGTSYNFTEIDIALRMDGETDQMTVSLRSDSAGQPSSVLESFVVTNGFGAGTSGVYALQSLTNPLMAAGTYHVTIEPIADAAGKWMLNNGGGQGAMVVSNDGGGSWTAFTDTNGAITVQGTPVPEPATFAVLGLGGLLAARRRKKASR